MHIERVGFDRVFDAPPRSSFFSFESAGQAHYGVILPGRRVPREGTQLVVALAQAGDWQSVLGWRDPATGEIALRDGFWQIAGYDMDLVWDFGPWVLAGSLALGVALGGATGALFGGLTGLAIVAGTTALIVANGLRRRRRVRSALAQAA